jgi:DNA-binding MarR family transcriptional regulator
MEDHSRHLGHWIKQYTLLVNRALDKTLKPYDIGRSQWYILYHLHHEGKMAQHQLQSILHIESATITNLMTALVKKELVKQTADPNNKRYKVVQLTAKGEALWQEMPDPLKLVRSRSLRGISAEDIATARNVIMTAAHNLTDDK